MMHWQDVLKATCALGLLWVILEWRKALGAMMDPKSAGVKKRTKVVLHLLRASAISAAMCIAVSILSIGGAVTHSSAVAALLFFGVVAVVFGIYLAVIYGPALLAHLRS